MAKPFTPTNLLGKKGFDSGIFRRFRSIGLSVRDSLKIISIVKLWLLNEGPKGYLLNVARQKRAWLNFEAKIQDSIPGCSRKGLIPVRTAFLGRYKVATRFRCLKFLKGLITSKELTNDQWLKFYNSATRPEPDPSIMERCMDLVAIGALGFSNRDHLASGDPDPVTMYPDQFGNKTFSPFDTRSSIPRTPLAVIKDSLKMIAANPWLEKLLPGIISTMSCSVDEPKTAGLIGVTQEPGCKARFFISAHPLYQSLFSPLQRALSYRARIDPNSVAFDQDKGRNYVAKMLSEGVRVFSYDLSDATNNFPLDLQTHWMGSTDIPRETLYEFYRVCRMPFKTCEEIYALTGVDTVTYTVGQPLGLLPSAMAFHLTHIYLLRGLEKELYRSIRVRKPRFLVCLDDVVIFDERLAKLYKETILSLGIPISESKSIVSDKISEFLGRIIVPKGPIVLTQQKRVTLENVVEYARVMPGVIRELKSRKTIHCLEPLLSLPFYLGGADLGNGIPLETRLKEPCLSKWISDRLSQFRNIQISNVDINTRVRAILSIVATTPGIKLHPDTFSYLRSVLPRAKSIVPATWICHPSGKVSSKDEKATLETIPIKGGVYPSVLIRESRQFRDILSIPVPNLRKGMEYRKRRIIQVNSLRKFLLNCVGSA